MGTGDERRWPGWAKAAVTFVLAASAAWLAAWLAVANGPLRGPAAGWQAFPHQPWVDGWVRWDAMWYVNIARDGYWLRPGEQSPVAYFPGYPLAIRAASALTGQPIATAIGLTLVFGLCGALVFRRWASRLVGARAALMGLGLLLAFPFSFFLYGAVYSDALFLLLVVGAFALLEEDHPVLAGLVGAMACATRPVGPALAMGLAIRAWQRWRRPASPGAVRWRELAVLVAPLGLAGYMAFLHLRFGDPLAFAHVMSAPGWDQAPGPATWFKHTFFAGLIHGPGPFIRLRLAVHALAALAGLAMVAPVWRKLGPAYAVYVAMVVGIPALSTKDFVGLGRYVVAAFPCFAVAGAWLEARPRLGIGLCVASGAAMLAGTAAFALGIYVS